VQGHAVQVQLLDLVVVDLLELAASEVSPVVVEALEEVRVVVVVAAAAVVEEAVVVAEEVVVDVRELVVSLTLFMIVI
jgi:hypothetical protein